MNPNTILSFVNNTNYLISVHYSDMQGAIKNFILKPHENNPEIRNDSLQATISIIYPSAQSHLNYFRSWKNLSMRAVCWITDKGVELRPILSDTTPNSKLGETNQEFQNVQV